MADILRSKFAEDVKVELALRKLSLRDAQTLMAKLSPTHQRTRTR